MAGKRSAMHERERALLASGLALSTVLSFRHADHLLEAMGIGGPGRIHTLLYLAGISVAIYVATGKTRSALDSWLRQEEGILAISAPLVWGALSVASALLLMLYVYTAPWPMLGLLTADALIVGWLWSAGTAERRKHLPIYNAILLLTAGLLMHLTFSVPAISTGSASASGQAGEVALHSWNIMNMGALAFASLMDSAAAMKDVSLLGRLFGAVMHMAGAALLPMIALSAIICHALRLASPDAD
jgi:hypothetical protein